jgi:hypothetical protein
VRYTLTGPSVKAALYRVKLYVVLVPYDYGPCHVVSCSQVALVVQSSKACVLHLPHASVRDATYANVCLRTHASRSLFFFPRRLRPFLCFFFPSFFFQGGACVRTHDERDSLCTHGTAAEALSVYWLYWLYWLYWC